MRKRVPVSESGKQLHLRLSSDDHGRLTKLGRSIPMPMHAIAREAMRLGMAALERDPTAFVAQVAIA